MAHVFRKNEIDTQVQYAIDTQSKDENCIYFHKQAGAVSIVSHREFITELDRWKTTGQIKKLEVRRANCGELVRNHKKFYQLVFQHKNSDDDACPIGLFCFKYMVSGYVYYFTDKESRDIVLRMYQMVYGGAVID